MSELSVRAQYTSALTTNGSRILRLTFPLWGVILPLISVVMLVALLYSAFGPTHETSALSYIGIPFAFFTLAASSLVATRILSQSALLLNKAGIELPFDLRFGHPRYIPWSSVRKVDLIGETSTNLKEKSLVFYFDKGGPVQVSLARIQPSDVEQVLIAIEMWNAGSEINPSLISLKDNLSTENAANNSLSYTAMWEDELRRRFSSTAFVPLAPGQVLRNGSLKIVRQLSLGGLSAVYLCQLNGNKLVVLKEAVIPEDNSPELRAKASELFEREALILSKLSHPDIVKVMDYFGDLGRNYLLLEYVNGQDLRQFVKQNGPQREDKVVSWAIQIVGMLKYLHSQEPPVLHRDLSPDNFVLREDGTLVLIDFGAANEFISKATGTFVGKQSFIAPEQFRGKAVVQSDLYALGCTLFFLLTGEEPDALSTSDPKESGVSVSDELAEVIVCCTQLEAAERYQSASQLLPVLRQISVSVGG